MTSLNKGNRKYILKARYRSGDLVVISAAEQALMLVERHR